MIEGNATLDVSSYLSGLQWLSTGDATIMEASIIAQCEIIGDETTCWCETDYIWSDLVCDYVNSCCIYPPPSKCVANISDYTPLCVPKVNVTLNGSIDILTVPMDLKSVLTSQFSQMNGFSSVDVTSRSGGVNFIVNLNATFKTPKVQDILSALRNKYSAITNINVTSIGLANMEIPQKKVCYNSKLIINCSTEEQMDTCMWQISRANQGPQVVGTGTEVDMLFQPSCQGITAISLKNITWFWAGIYTCLFINGSVSHAASAELRVALLPEAINFTSVPPNPDCSSRQDIQVTVICVFSKSEEKYTVTINDTVVQSGSSNIMNYSKDFTIKCAPESPAFFIAVCNITNSLDQSRTTVLKVPIIQPGDPICDQENAWPKTKSGVKAVILCTDPGRVGTKERTCNGSTWGEPVDLCVKEALNQLSAAAGDFEKGVGATQEVAIAIFDNLKNTTSAENSYGDVSATVSVFTTMSRASSKIDLGEALLPNFIDSASNILNTTWVSDEHSTTNLATSYLSSVEDLVKNIKLNNSEGHNSSNIQLQVCRNTPSCNRTVFNVVVELNSTSGEGKMMGLQNISQYLPRNGFKDSKKSLSLVVSATVNTTVNTTGPVNIRLAFPVSDEDKSNYNSLCVFWNLTEKQWSQDGCNYTQTGNISYCECDHLTSFSMLLSKTPVDLPFMDQITYIGLGISICSLVVFLLIEGLVWSAVVKTNLSHFRHTALVNISLCLLLADCSFVAGTFQNILNDTWCLLLVVAKHFFFLAMFFWMLCLSIMLLHQLIFVFHPLRKKIYMILSMTIGYVCPTVTVGATYMYYAKNTDVKYYSRTTCWLTYDSPLKGSIHAFLFPLGTIVFINMFSMVVVIVTLLKPAAAESNKKDDKEAAKSIIKVIIFLTPVFGGTWILGLFVFLMDDNTFSKVLIHYAFTIVNSLQGFFILLTGCFGEKRVRDEIVKLVISGKSAKSESKRNLTTSMAKN
ncbi:hypothetical protein AOLI_G00029360 [Acnodon oligacanthus]